MVGQNGEHLCFSAIKKKNYTFTIIFNIYMSVTLKFANFSKPGTSSYWSVEFHP